MTTDPLKRLSEVIWDLRWYQLQTLKSESLQRAEKALKEELRQLLHQIQHHA